MKVLEPATLRGYAAWAVGFWVLWMAILPLGHVTALRNALALPAIGLAIAVAVPQAGGRSWAQITGLAVWLGRLPWRGLSMVGWHSPALTGRQLGFVLLIPFGASLGGYGVAGG